MQKLGLFDQVFYKADQYGGLSMVMAGASIIAPVRGSGPLVAAEIADHLAARLEKIALMRSKFVQDPLRLGSVHRVENADFNISDHIAVASISAPGEDRELTAGIERLCSEPLSLEQLWKWTVLDGLAGGRVAVFCRIHHALADGVGATEALMSMYDEQPVAPEKPRRAGFTRASTDPTRLALLGRAIAESGQRLFLKTPRFIGKRTIPIVAAVVGRLRDGLRDGDGWRPAPLQRTSLNTGMPSQRRLVSFKTLSRDEIRKLARHFDCKVNDIGLLLYSFAMEEYFHGVGETVDFDLNCGIPLSTRSGKSGEGGNQVSFGVISLHNSIPDAQARLEAIRQDTRNMKAQSRPEQPVVDADELAALVPPLSLDLLFYLDNRLSLSDKVLKKLPFLHAVFSNVPGPAQRLFIANGELVDSIPIIPAASGLAVSGGIGSVAATITIGFNCDSEVVKDKGLFVRGVERGLEALRAALPPDGSGDKERATPRRRTTGARKPGARKPGARAPGARKSG